MSVEFRQRTAGEFWQMLMRRKWLIVLPIITMTAAIGYVVYKLPSVYESTTLLTLKPPTISSNVAPSSEEDLSARLQTISQEVLSRSVLEPMITKYNLFEIERNAGMDQSLIIAKMKKNILVEMEKGDNEKVAAFRLSYRDRTPAAARNVAAELASKYVNAQVVSSEQRGQVTKDFIDNELKTSKDSLDALDKQRLGIMMQNVETLPDAQSGLIAQLQGLRTREDSITKEKETISTEKGRINSDISSLNSQARLIEDFGQKETQDQVKGSGIEDTPAYAQLINKRADLSAQLDNLLKKFKPAHPDVEAKKNEIKRVNDEIDDLNKNTQQRASNATAAGTRRAELQKQNLEIERQKKEAQIAQLDQQMQFKDQELAQNAQQIAALEGKINQIPNVKVALESVNNQYLSAKQTYDDLLKKNNDASFSANVESNSLGETIRVQDAANLPQTPVAPKRAVLTAVGAGLGLALGLLLAALFEIPRLFKIQTIEDAKHYTGLPVLASVPPLLSHEEKTWIKRSHWLKVLAGIAVAVGIIPLLAMGLQATHIFEKLVS